MNPLLKKILIAVVVLAVIFAAYRIFFAKEPEAPLSSETTGLPVEDGDLLSLLLQLKSLKLSDELLADPTFVTLQDFTVNLAPEPVGRRNPFAVIGAVEKSPATASTSTTTPATP